MICFEKLPEYGRMLHRYFCKFDGDSDSPKNNVLESYRLARNSKNRLGMISFEKLPEYDRMIHYSIEI